MSRCTSVLAALLAPAFLAFAGCSKDPLASGKPGGDAAPPSLDATAAAADGGASPDTGAGERSPAATPDAAGDDGQPGLAPDATPVPDAALVPDATPPASYGEATLRRLTARQYLRTVRDLLGASADGQLTLTALPADDVLAGRITASGPGALGEADAERYAEAAARLAGAAVMNLGGLAPCAPPAGEAACARRFIESFGWRAYRRPLAAAEVERYVQLHAAGGDFATGVRLVVEAMLQSPHFLYLVEPAPRDANGRALPLDGWAVASRLSYALLGSLPDDTLLNEAARGALGSAEQVAAQARRLMSDVRFRDVLDQFHADWLALEELSAPRDTSAQPDWSGELRSLLDEQVRRFAAAVIVDGDGRLETLLGARYSILSGPLYDLYGVPRPPGAGASEWRRVDLPPAQRSGIFTHGAVLAASAVESRWAYVTRGELIREALLCNELPPHPPGFALPVHPETATARERAGSYGDPACSSCHSLIDPIGLGFENYDAVGRYRTLDGGKAIDSSFSLLSTEGLDGPYASALELMPRASAAPEVRRCLAQHWLRFMLGRLEQSEDNASLAAAVAAMSAEQGSIPALLRGLAGSNAFRYQRGQP